MSAFYGLVISSGFCSFGKTIDYIWEETMFISISRSRIRAIFFKIIQIHNQLRISNVFIFLSSQWGKTIMTQSIFENRIRDEGSLIFKSLGIYQKKTIFCFFVLSHAWSFISLLVCVWIHEIIYSIISLENTSKEECF